MGKWASWHRQVKVMMHQCFYVFHVALYIFVVALHPSGCLIMVILCLFVICELCLLFIEKKYEQSLHTDQAKERDIKLPLRCKNNKNKCLQRGAKLQQKDTKNGCKNTQNDNEDIQNKNK